MSYVQYEWYLKQDLSKYAGKWVAVIDKKITAYDTDVETLIKKVKKEHPRKKPLIAKVKKYCHLIRSY